MFKVTEIMSKEADNLNEILKAFESKKDFNQNSILNQELWFIFYRNESSNSAWRTTRKIKVRNYWKTISSVFIRFNPNGKDSFKFRRTDEMKTCYW